MRKNPDSDKLHTLFAKGQDTLKVLMFTLRLQNEWFTLSKQYYQEAPVTPDECIKLLLRCFKLYDAKAAVTKLLKLHVEKTRLVSRLQSKDFGDLDEAKAILTKVSQIGVKLLALVTRLQAEHKTLRRPFVVHGNEYIPSL